MEMVKYQIVIEDTEEGKILYKALIPQVINELNSRNIALDGESYIVRSQKLEVFTEENTIVSKFNVKKVGERIQTTRDRLEEMKLIHKNRP